MFKITNSLHLWLSSQPADVDISKITALTLSQNEERVQLAKQAYFGWAPWQALRTLDYNLPRIDKSSSTAVVARTIFMAQIESPKVDLGQLDQLSLELINHILSLLDISALDHFKAVNRRAFVVVNAHPQFKVINRQAHDVLRGLRAVKTGARITVQRLFEKLCASQCCECADYGGYMYLMTFQRVCSRCFMENDRYLPLGEFDALKTFGLTPKMLGALPRIQGYPGCYGHRREWRQGYISLIDRDSAKSMGIAHHGSFESMQQYVANTDDAVWKSYNEEIKECEKKLTVERAEHARVKRTEWKAYVKKRNAQKMKVVVRREERAGRLGITYRYPGSRTEDIERLDEDTDNESVSTFAPESESDQDTNDDRDRSDNISGDEEEPNSLAQCHLRYMAVIRVPWFNRRSGQDEWGFHCVGCMGLHGEENREFITSTFREHLKEYGPIKDGVHRTNDYSNTGVFKSKVVQTIPAESPFWGWH